MLAAFFHVTPQNKFQPSAEFKVVNLTNTQFTSLNHTENNIRRTDEASKLSVRNDAHTVSRDLAK